MTKQEFEKQQKKDQKKLESFRRQYLRLCAKYPEVVVYPNMREEITAEINRGFGQCSFVRL